MTVQEIAEATNVTERRVYQIAKKLGRLPTIEEVENRKGKRGRPKKSETVDSSEETPKRKVGRPRKS